MVYYKIKSLGLFLRRFEWKKTGIKLTTREMKSEVTVTWTIPQGTEPGTYSIGHRGYAKIDTGTFSYEGRSQTFEVVNTRKPIHYYY